MIKLLTLGLIVSFVFVPFVFNESSFAVKSIQDISPSHLEPEHPNIVKIQSFQPDTEPPFIKITNPNHCPPSFINGNVTVQGISSDSDRVKMVEAFAHPIPLDGEIYFEPATPNGPDDWSTWSIPLNIPDDQPYRILVHAYDYSGNEEWDETMVNTERSKTYPQALADESEIKIAFVEPTFTNAAYNLDSFYFFYSKYYFTPAEQEITTDLDLLTGDIPLEYEIDYFQNIFNRVNQTLPNSFVAVIGDEEIHNGMIFEKEGNNLYDVLIFLHSEYVTQQYYDNMIDFLKNGGSVIFLNGNMFYAEILFDKELCTATLVEGHDWKFNGTSAKPSISERYLNENSEWFGSNYIVNSLEDDVIFENNPFGYTHFEENHVTNPQAEILLDYKVKFAQPQPTGPRENPFVLGGLLKEETPIQYSNENKTVATYELISGNGKVIHTSLYSQRLDSNPAFLNYFEKIILPRALDQTHPIESDYDTPALYWMLPGGEISDVKLNSESKNLSLKASFNPNKKNNLQESYLTVVIPKIVLDSHVENNMTGFVVTVNGSEVQYEESSDDIERGLKIKIAGDSDIEIMGTSAIPEFEISMIILTLSILGLVLLSTGIFKMPPSYGLARIT